MSTQYGKLVSLILYEYFGEIVQKVGTHLYKYGWSPLAHVVKYTELSVPKVKLAISVLIKHGLLSFKPSHNEIYAEYRLQSDRVLLILRYPKYLLLIKKLFGEEAEMLLEEILISGYVTATGLIVKVAKRQKENRPKETALATVKDKFVSLVVAKYVKRHPQRLDDKPVPTFDASTTPALFQTPTINMARLIECHDSAEDKPGERESDPECYWCVNFDRLHQDFRDRAMVSAMGHRFDENAGELMRVMLQQMYTTTEPWAQSSNPLCYTQLKGMVCKLNSHGQLVSYLDHYLTVLSDDDSRFIQKMGDAGGGQYTVELKTAAVELAWAVLENIVLEKYGWKAARIFRLIRAKRFIEPDQIQQLAMIPAKEAKRLSYELLEGNFVQVQELRKAGSSSGGGAAGGGGGGAGATGGGGGATSGPNRSFILFHVDLNQVVCMVLEICYKALCNTMTRRHHDKLVNRRIIDKKHRVDTIIMGLKVQGADDQHLLDIEEMITPPEKELLDKIGKTMKKLNLAELEIDDTIFLLQLYLLYR